MPNRGSSGSPRSLLSTRNGLMCMCCRSCIMSIAMPHAKRVDLKPGWHKLWYARHSMWGLKRLKRTLKLEVGSQTSKGLVPRHKPCGSLLGMASFSGGHMSTDPSPGIAAQQHGSFICSRSPRRAISPESPSTFLLSFAMAMGGRCRPPPSCSLCLSLSLSLALYLYLIEIEIQ